MVMDLQDICDELERDLCLTRLKHIAARRRLEREDTRETRVAEAECCARLDVILDLLVELKETQRRERADRTQGHVAPVPFTALRRAR